MASFCQSTQQTQRKRSRLVSSLSRSGTSGGGISKDTMAKRNERERNRVKHVNVAFEKLRLSVPWTEQNAKMSKVDTLRAAKEYIAMLQEVLSGPPLHDKLAEPTREPGQVNGNSPSSPPSSSHMSLCQTSSGFHDANPPPPLLYGPPRLSPQHVLTSHYPAAYNSSEEGRQRESIGESPPMPSYINYASQIELIPVSPENICCPTTSHSRVSTSFLPPLSMSFGPLTPTSIHHHISNHINDSNINRHIENYSILKSC